MIEQKGRNTQELLIGESEDVVDAVRIKRREGEFDRIPGESPSLGKVAVSKGDGVIAMF